MANGTASEKRECLLRVDNIRKAFGDQPVLQDVSLEVDKGDVIAILGPSGSGKTTLLRCLNFLERADGGTLTFDGETFDLHQTAKRDIARLRHKTAFVFQSYNLFLNKTALGNIMEGLVVARKMPKAEAKAEKKAVSAAPQAPTPASKQSIFADPGKTLLNAFNTGVSYFIPIVVIGGVFLAFSLASGTAGASGMEVTNPLMVSLNTIGMAGISMMIPVLAAYIAYSMAGKPALAPGFVLGYLVNNAVVTPSGNSVSTGFLGAMIMAVICGYFVRWMKTWKVNNTIQTIMPILIIPILTSLVLGMAYIYILATPLGFVMDWLTSVLGSLQGGSAVVLGLVIGVMTAFDMGGPINKTASTFTMAIMASGIYGPNGMFRVAVAIPPIACGLAALIAKNKFDDADRQMGISALFMGCIGITEGAIPFAVKDLGHTLPGICIGSAVGAALAAFQGIDCYVPHGGFIVALATNNVALFCLDIVIGSVVAAAILIAMKPTLDKQAK